MISIDDSFKEYGVVFTEHHEGISSEEDLQGPVRFRYGNVSCDAFKKEYIPKCSLRGKVTAVPLAMLGIAKTIYHAFCTLFGGVANIKAHAFICARDLEEVAGRIVGLFSETRGAYYVQDALFHKNCYKYSSNPQPKVYQEEKQMTDDQLCHFDFRDCDQQVLAEMFPTDENQREESLRRFALLSIGQVNSLLKEMSLDQAQLISDEQLQHVDLIDCNQKNVDNMFPINEEHKAESLRRFALLSANQVNDVFVILGGWLRFLLIGKEQIGKLNISKLNKELVLTICPSFAAEKIQRDWEYVYRLNGVDVKDPTFHRGVQAKIEAIKKANLENLNLLSPSQRADIRDKLTKENQELLDTLLSP